MNSNPNFITVLLLKLIQVWDRGRLLRRMRNCPGLQIDASASSNFATAKFDLAPDAQLVIGPGVVTERIREGVRFEIGAGASVVVEEGAWLRTDIAPVFLRAAPGARIVVGRASQLSACMLTAKTEITVGRNVLIGMGTRIFDSDQHAVDVAHPEVSLPVHVEDHAWIAADVTVLRGVTVGTGSVVGTRSLVRSSVEPHTVVSGVPAKLYGKVGDRTGLDR
jgi:serine acetyltransferase